MGSSSCYLGPAPTFFEASSTGKKTNPPSEIQMRRGCHPRMKAPIPSVRAMVSVASSRELYLPLEPWVIKRVLSTSRGVVTMPAQWGEITRLDWCSQPAIVLT